MNRETFNLCSEAFAVTPGGEVVIDNKKLAKVLADAKDNQDSISVEIVVDITLPTDPI